jgi:hypothetical protein
MHMLAAGALIAGQGGNVKSAGLAALAACLYSNEPTRKGAGAVPSSARLPIYTVCSEVLGNDSVPVVLMGCAKQPFADIKKPSYSVLESIAVHEWGQGVRPVPWVFLNKPLELSVVQSVGKYRCVCVGAQFSVDDGWRESLALARCWG